MAGIVKDSGKIYSSAPRTDGTPGAKKKNNQPPHTHTEQHAGRLPRKNDGHGLERNEKSPSQKSQLFNRTNKKVAKKCRLQKAPLRFRNSGVLWRLPGGSSFPPAPLPQLLTPGLLFSRSPWKLPLALKGREVGSWKRK